jgi:hypothetical protein
MEQNLWLIRLKSFGYKFATLVGTTIVAALVSDQFVGQLTTLITSHTSETVWGGLIVLLLPEVVAHIRNKIIVGSSRKKFGSTATFPPGTFF